MRSSLPRKNCSVHSRGANRCIPIHRFGIDRRIRRGILNAFGSENHKLESYPAVMKQPAVLSFPLRGESVDEPHRNRTCT